MSFLDFREPVSAWSHCAGLLLAVPGTFLLWRRSAGEPAKRITLLIYGLTLAFCYSASTLYHGVRLPAAGIARFARLDSVGIFALIAGSYTPLACCLLRGQWRRWTLLLVWSVAGAATLLLASGRHFSPMLATGVYLGMGWGVVACYFEFAQVLSHRARADRRRWPLLQRRGRVQRSRTGPSSCPEPSALMSSFTSSCWRAAWLITCSCSKSSRHSARRHDRAAHAS